MRTNPKILLVGPYKPYGSGEFAGEMPQYMELLENQLTRYQNGTSPRIFHNSFGLHFIAANIKTPTAVLEFPSWRDFLVEISLHRYDIIGIGAILPNFKKVQKMCRAIRVYSPLSKIVIGGHLGNDPSLCEQLDADHIVRGEGIAWFRKLIGQPETDPIAHPIIRSSFGQLVMGLPISHGKAGTIVPGVGCPMGCKFCSTSHKYSKDGRVGGKIDFFSGADEIFSIMLQMEKRLGFRHFFIMDENFLGRKKTILELADLMEKHDCHWTMHGFSTAKHVQEAGQDLLDRLGVTQIWIGLENNGSQYGHKLSGIDTVSLIRQLRNNGVSVIGSTILGELHHDAKESESVIEEAISHGCDFHQFMLLTVLPSTPLYREFERDGRLISWDECPPEDFHGGFRFNFNHPLLRPGSETNLIQKAFTDDLLRNGPSIIRFLNTVLNRRIRLKGSDDLRIRTRTLKETAWLWPAGAALAWAINQEPMKYQAFDVLQRINREFGLKSRITSPILGRIFHYFWKRDDKRRQEGWNPEPPTFRWCNRAAKYWLFTQGDVRFKEIQAVLPSPKNQ